MAFKVHAQYVVLLIIQINMHVLVKCGLNSSWSDSNLWFFTLKYSSSSSSSQSSLHNGAI